jgi:Tol biopolymer transport system component
MFALRIGVTLVTAVALLVACGGGGGGRSGGILFDAGSRTMSGNFIFVIQPDETGLKNLTPTAFSDSQAAWSPDGTKIAFAHSLQIFVMNADGTGLTDITPNPPTPIAQSEPAWSPDATKIAFTGSALGVIHTGGDIYVKNADGAGQHNLTANPANDNAPTWSPDGTKIAFESNRSGNTDIWVMNAADGSGLTNLTSHPASDTTPDWSPDGTKIAFVSNRPAFGETTRQQDVYVMDAGGGSLANLTRSVGEFDGEPTWSPDGSQLAFRSNRDGDHEIYVMNADGSGQRRLIHELVADGAPDW